MQVTLDGMNATEKAGDRLELARHLLDCLLTASVSCMQVSKQVHHHSIAPFTHAVGRIGLNTIRDMLNISDSLVCKATSISQKIHCRGERGDGNGRASKLTHPNTRPASLVL